MADFSTFKAELTLVVSGLAKAVVTEIFNAAEKVSLNKNNPEAEEKFSVVVDALCVQAVEKILNMVANHDSAGNPEAEGETATISSSPLPLPPLPPPPPPQSDVPDHEYARHPASSSSSSPLDAASSSSSSHTRKRRSGRRPSAPPSESHLQCSQCSMLFPNASRLSDHQRKCHPACSLCGAVFSGVLRLREHALKEHGVLPYACDYCPKRFNHKAHRDLHVKARHTGEKSFQCDVCGKGYACASVLRSHRLTHFDKAFVCDVCGKRFYHACHLTRHKAAHGGARPHRCDTCGKTFTQAANLRAHQAVHTGERPLCAICGRSYRCLKSHIISKHPEDGDAIAAAAATGGGDAGAAGGDAGGVACSVCGKKFPNQSQLKVHQRSHTGEKPFGCAVCGKSYSMKQQLKEHMHSHSGEKPYGCSLCGRSFNLATSYTRHRSIHSGETPYSCLSCGKHFRLLAFLKAHLQTKTHLRQTQSH